MTLRSPRARLPWGAVGSLVVDLMVAAYLTWPYGWDQGVYAWMAQTIRGGGVAYRDAWDMKGPAAPYLTAFAQTVFGDSPAGLRWFDLVMLVVGGAATYQLALQLLESRRSAIAAVALQTAWYFALGYWNTAQTDGWMSWLMTLAALIAVRARRPTALLAAGLLLGIALLLKPLYLAFAIPLVLFALPGTRNYRPAAAIVSGFVGAAIALGIVMLLFARAGALADARAAFIDYNRGVYAALPPGTLADTTRKAIEWLLMSRVLPTALPLAALGWMMWATHDRAIRAGVIAWIAGALVMVVLQAKFYDYHTLVALPPLSILAGHGILTVWDAVRQRQEASSRRLAALGAPLLVLLFVQLTVFTANDVARWGAHVAGLISEEQYLDGFGIPGAEFRIAGYLSAHSAPADKVLMWGMNTSVLALSHRRAWTRFGFNLPFVFQPARPAAQRIRAELVRGFDSSAPRFIVIGERHGLLDRSGPDPLECGLLRLIGTAYELRQTAGLLRIYERTATGPVGPLTPSPCP